jgi:uncharacterized protein (TIRG00374 family)
MTRKYSWVAVQGLVTIGLLGLLFRGFDWVRFWELVQGIPPWLYLGSLIVVVVGQLLYAWKWRLVLQGMGVEVPFWRLSEQYFIGVFFNSFLPTTVGGDWARIYYLGRERGYPSVAASVFMDRFLGLFSLTVLGTGLAWAGGLTAIAFAVGRHVLTVLLVLFAIAFMIALRVPVERLASMLPLSGGRLDQVGDGFRRFVVQVRGVARRPTIILGVMGIVLLYACLVSVVYRGFFRLATGAELSFLAILTVVMMIAVLANVPITVNGIGLREQLHFLLFATLGLPKEASVSLSLLMFSHILVVGLAGCWLWIRWTRRRPG